MKKIFLVFSLLVLIQACASDPMGLTSSVNRQLDSSINDQLNRIKADTSVLAHLNLSLRDVHKMDSSIKSYWTPINLYNACTVENEKAKQFFNDWALKLNLDKNSFITTNERHVKSQIIVIIKQNGVTLLDHLVPKQE